MGKSMNTREAAAFLGLSAGTLEVWRHYGRGPKFVRMGRRILYDPKDLESYRETRKVLTTDVISERLSR